MSVCLYLVLSQPCHWTLAHQVFHMLTWTALVSWGMWLDVSYCLLLPCKLSLVIPPLFLLHTLQITFLWTNQVLETQLPLTCGLFITEFGNFVSAWPTLEAGSCFLDAAEALLLRRSLSCDHCSWLRSLEWLWLVLPLLAQDHQEWSSARRNLKPSGTSAGVPAAGLAWPPLGVGAAAEPFSITCCTSFVSGSFFSWGFHIHSTWSPRPSRSAAFVQHSFKSSIPLCRLGCGCSSCRTKSCSCSVKTLLFILSASPILPVTGTDGVDNTLRTSSRSPSCRELITVISSFFKNMNSTLNFPWTCLALEFSTLPYHRFAAVFHLGLLFLSSLSSLGPNAWHGCTNIESSSLESEFFNFKLLLFSLNEANLLVGSAGASLVWE